MYTMKDYIENCRNYFESPAFYRGSVSSRSVLINYLLLIKPCFRSRNSRILYQLFRKRTLTTTRCQAGVPEQEIMERTNHLLMDSVRKYKRPSTEMLIDISNLLEPQLENVKRATSQKRENHLSDPLPSPLPSPTTHYFKSVTFFFKTKIQVSETGSVRLLTWIVM